MRFEFWDTKEVEIKGDDRERRVGMKTRSGMVLSAFALMMCVGCVLLKSEEEWNEVVCELTKRTTGHFEGFYMTCVEQTNGSADTALKTSDVCIVCRYELQVYRIEGNTIKNYYWSDYVRYGVEVLQEDDDKQTAWKECQHLIDKLWTMRKALEQLPSRLGQVETHSQPLENSPAVTITKIHSDFFFAHKFGVLTEATNWNNWAAWQWAGVPEEVPEGIEAFRQNAVQVASAPKYARSYRSYVRAVPLFTQEALEAEKDTPLIDLEQTRYHVRSAMRYPYLLIPVPERKSPFYFKEYTPGDKFKVRYDNNGEPCYFLIETFIGNKR